MECVCGYACGVSVSICVRRGVGGGGDPLSVSDKSLRTLQRALDERIVERAREIEQIGSTTS